MSEKKQQRKTKSDSKTQAVKDGLIDILNPNKMLTSAQKVIHSAVNVLEEEIAAGILAAKHLEKKVFDSGPAEDNPENLMNRIRRDTHDALDIFLDAFSTLSKQVGIMTESVVNGNKNQNQDTSAYQKPKNGVQIIEYDFPAKAGEKITLLLSLQDDAIRSPLSLSLQSTDFTGRGNQKILRRYIKFRPASIVLKPGEEQAIAVEVTIPKSCKPSSFHSLLTIEELPDTKIILSLEVI